MRQLPQLRATAAAIVLLLFAAPGRAAWVPTAVCNAPANQLSYHATTDGAGGAIVAWLDYRNSPGGLNPQLFMQRLRSSDAVDPAWPVNGILVGPTYSEPFLASDGAGGAFVAWSRDATYDDVYAHHVLGSGALDPAWPASGVAVCVAPDGQDVQGVVSDGSGGFYVVWTDLRDNETTGWDVYAQRLLSTGAVASGWPANGLVVCNAADSQIGTASIGDGSGGLIVAWEDYRNLTDSDIYAQRVLSTGVVAGGWAANGVQLCSMADEQAGPRLCSDAAGGAIVGWSDLRSGNGPDIYAMRVRASGALGQGWAHDGEVMCSAAGDQWLYGLVADGSGGAIGAWDDYRPGDGTSDVYVQKVAASGAMSWIANGVAVSTAANDQVEPALVPDGAGGILIGWHDRRFETVPSNVEQYLHHVLSSGSPDPAWPANGGRVTFDGLVDYPQPYYPVLAANGSGATLFWHSALDIVGMNINSTWTPFYQVNVSIAPPAPGR